MEAKTKQSWVSRLFSAPALDSRIKSANTQASEMWLGYFAGPCFVYMVYYAVAGTYLTQFYTDVLGITGIFITLIMGFTLVYNIFNILQTNSMIYYANWVLSDSVDGGTGLQVAINAITSATCKTR